VKPLSSNPAVQAYVADQITKELFARLDATTYVKDALPAQAQALAAPLTTALQSFVREATVRVMQRPISSSGSGSMPAGSPTHSSSTS